MTRRDGDIFLDIKAAMNRSPEEWDNIQTMVPRALGQTYRAGFEYVCVPFEWWEGFCERAGRTGVDVSGVPWSELCMASLVDSGPEKLICIRGRYHEGDCGWVEAELAPDVGTGVTDP